MVSFKFYVSAWLKDAQIAGINIISGCVSEDSSGRDGFDSVD